MSCLRSLHRFPIIFKYGDCGGHSKMVMCLSWRYFILLILRHAWDHCLDGIRNISSTSMSGLTIEHQPLEFLNILWNLLFLPLTHYFPVPPAATQAQSIIDQYISTPNCDLCSDGHIGTFIHIFLGMQPCKHFFWNQVSST